MTLKELDEIDAQADSTVPYYVPRLTKALREAAETITRQSEALQSIANNSCCQPCREAGLVARKALGLRPPREDRDEPNG